MKITRKEALVLAAIFRFKSLSPEDYGEIKETILAEEGLDFLEPEQLDEKIRKRLIYRLSETKNSYIESIIRKEIGFSLSIAGAEPRLYTCNCCGYKTLKKKAEYFVCHVCFWEDDGMTDLKRYSACNSMKLEDGIKNFKKIGVYDPKYLKCVKEDRFRMYHKNEKIKIAFNGW